jgi:putative membrane protein
MGLIISFIANALALVITVNVVDGITIQDPTTLVIATIVVAIVNTIIKPILKLISLPITLVTFGLFAIVVNAACLGLAALFVPGFEISGIIPALIGAVVLSIVSTVIHFFTDKIGGKSEKKESHSEPSTQE